MRIGVGHKLVALLVVTAVLPLLAGLAVLTWEWRRLRVASAGEHLLSTAASQAAAMQGLLREDLAGALAQVRESQWIAGIMPAAANGQLSDSQARELDDLWPGLSDRSPPVQAVLHHPLAELLGRMCRTHARCREAFVTDERGYLLAASNKTSDYIQSDEPWWIHTFADGRGAAVVSDVNFDASANTWAIDVSVPVYADPERRDRVIGVLRQVLDLANWIERTREPLPDPSAEQLLLSPEGRVVFANGAPSERTVVAGPAVGLRRGWSVAGGQLRAYAPIDVGDELAGIPVSAPRWYVLVQMPQGAVVHVVDRMAWMALSVGLAFIVVAFAMGLWLFHRQIIWPLERLRAAADRIALGDLSSRVEGEDRRLAARDEIGQLMADFNRMADEVERSYRALAVASETKDRFLRVAGHELRTPVTYIVAMADLLARRQLDPARREAFEKLRDRAFQLERILTQMFTLLDEERMGARLRYSRFSAGDLVEEVARELAPFAQERSLRLEVPPPAQPVELTADHGKLHDALVNLAGNAIKFTPDGGVVTLVSERLADGRVAFHITDQGRGICEADLPHIFEAFWGGGDMLRHSSGQFGYQQRGAGLGLPIAQEFARLHGGGIRVRNSPQGCTFSLIVQAEPGKPGPDEKGA